MIDVVIFLAALFYRSLSVTACICSIANIHKVESCKKNRGEIASFGKKERPSFSSNNRYFIDFMSMAQFYWPLTLALAFPVLNFIRSS